MVNKKTKKSKPRHAFRNAAAPARSIRRAIARRRRGAIASDLAADDLENPPLPQHAQHDSVGWGTLKAAGGAVGTSVLGALIARQDWLPPKVMAGVLTGLGALLAVEGPNRLKALGVGAMSAAGGQLGFMLIDDQLIKSSQQREKEEHEKQERKRAAEQTSSSSPTPAKRQAGDIPADALARAYERARLRMALTTNAQGAQN
jgi:hypothetical protein